MNYFLLFKIIIFKSAKARFPVPPNNWVPLDITGGTEIPLAGLSRLHAICTRLRSVSYLFSRLTAMGYSPLGGVGNTMVQQSYLEKVTPAVCILLIVSHRYVLKLIYIKFCIYRGNESDFCELMEIFFSHKKRNSSKNRTHDLPIVSLSLSSLH